MPWEIRGSAHLRTGEITDAMGFAGYVAESQQSSLGGHAMVGGDVRRTESMPSIRRRLSMSAVVKPSFHGCQQHMTSNKLRLFLMILLLGGCSKEAARPPSSSRHIWIPTVPGSWNDLDLQHESTGWMFARTLGRMLATTITCLRIPTDNLAPKSRPLDLRSTSLCAGNVERI